MIVRKKSFAGIFRLAIAGVLGLLSVCLATTLTKDELSTSPVYVGAVGAAISLLALTSGLRARKRLRLFRIDEHGLHLCQENSESASIAWTDVKAVRQCHGQLVLVDTNGVAHAYDCSKTSHTLCTIAGQCLDQLHRVNGVATLRESIKAHPPILCCGKCGKETEHLKDSVFFVVVFMYFYNFVYRKYSLTCPRCTRKTAYQVAAINVILANFLWPLIVLPYCLLQWLRSFRSGHSRSVLNQLTIQKVQELTT